VTSSGRAVYPALSPDGSRLAYAEPHCRGNACAYGILVRDLGTTAVRNLGVEATVIWTMRWSPDGSVLLFTGIAGKGWATYLVPAAGGSAIRVAPECAILSPDGRSLLWTAEMGRGSEHHVEVGGLPGTRFVIRGYAEYFMLETAVPDSRWIIVRVDAGEKRDELRAVDLTGAEGGSFLATGLGAAAVLASRDAVWLQVDGEAQGTVNILRVPFDRQTGQFATKAETVYTGDSAGSPAIFSVTADGRTLALLEARTEFGGWATSMEDVRSGNLPAGRRLLSGVTQQPGLRISPDGERLLVKREGRWSVAPFAGGKETPLGEGIEDARWNNAATLRVKEKGPRGSLLSLIDALTGARSASFELTEAANDFVSLPRGRWAWIGEWGTVLNVQGPDDKAVRRVPIPGFTQTISLDATADGRQVGVFGYGEPAADSPLAVSVISLDDGQVRLWWSDTGYDDSGGAHWLPDGSLLLPVLESPGITGLFRVYGPGKVKKLGVVPRALADFTVSQDLRRSAVVTLSVVGDIWLRSHAEK
jgi:hypothetical protein